MARRQTLRAGEIEKLVNVSPGQTTAKACVPNYGHTHFSDSNTSLSSGTTQEAYVLDAPEEGVDKYITWNLTTYSTAVSVTVQLATTNNVKIGTDTTGLIVTATSAAQAQSGVHLRGVNSTEWAVVGSLLTTFTT